MKFIIAICFVCISLLLQAQKPPTQAEINKMMKQYENDPQVKEAMKQAGIKNFESMEDAMPDLDGATIPARNTKALAALPASILTETALASFITDINTQLWSKLSPEEQNKVREITDSFNHSPLHISRAAIAVWQKKSSKPALYLASHAAKMDVKEDEVLNTLGGILNLAGAEHKAIPILQYLNQQVPGNSTVLNNLGQAYLGLGDVTTAERYLVQCIGTTPLHVEANKSLALIYKTNGQLTKAKTHIKKSLESAYSPGAVEMARTLGIDDEEIDDILITTLKLVKAPEYFNNYKYQIPRSCRNVNEAYEVSALHTNFQQNLQNEIDKYESLINTLTAQMETGIQQMVTGTSKGKLVFLKTTPMFEKAIRMVNYWTMEINKWSLENYNLYLNHQELIDKYETEYNEGLVKINNMNVDDKCPLIDELSNKYLPLYADAQKNFQDKFLLEYRGYLDELMFWSQYLNIHGSGRIAVLGFVKGHFQELQKLSRNIKIIDPACGYAPETKIVEEVHEFIEPPCPIDVKLNYLIGSIELNCEKMVIDIDAGLSFTAEKNFVTKETTLAIGAGLGFEVKEAIPLASAKGSIEASQKFFIVFDANNNPCDVGIEFKVGAKLEAKAGFGPISDKQALGGQFGYRLGLNSGWNFNGETNNVNSRLLN